MLRCSSSQHQPPKEDRIKPRFSASQRLSCRLSFQSIYVPPLPLFTLNLTVVSYTSIMQQPVSLGRHLCQWQTGGSRLILRRVLCTYLAVFQDRDRWPAVVSAVVNIRVAKMRGISWLAEDVLASQEGLCFLDSVSHLVSLLISYLVNLQHKCSVLQCYISHQIGVLFSWSITR